MIMYTSTQNLSPGPVMCVLLRGASIAPSVRYTIHHHGTGQQFSDYFNCFSPHMAHTIQLLTIKGIISYHVHIGPVIIHNSDRCISIFKLNLDSSILIVFRVITICLSSDIVTSGKPKRLPIKALYSRTRSLLVFPTY